jgi:hypothetical protein
MYTKHRHEQKHTRKAGAGTPLYDSSLVKTGKKESKKVEEKNLEVVSCTFYYRGCLFMHYALCTEYRQAYSHQEGYKAKFWAFTK